MSRIASAISFGRDRRGEEDDVDARRHDVAKFEFAELVDAFVDGDRLGRASDAPLRDRRCARGAARGPTRGAAGRSLTVGAPDAHGRGTEGFVLVLLATEQRAHRGAHALGIEGLDEETFGPTSSSEEDVRSPIEQHEYRRPARPRRRTLRGEVPCRWPCRPSRRSAGRRPRGRRRPRSTRASTSGPLATSSMKRSGPSSIARSSWRSEARSLARRTVATMSA